MTSGAGSGLSRKRRKATPEPNETTETTETTETQSPEASASEAPTLAEEVPPAPATVSPKEAAEADKLRDRARENPTQSPGSSSPEQNPTSNGIGRKAGRPKGSKNKGGTRSKPTGEHVVVVDHRPVVYVDPDGNRLPDLGPDFMAPIIFLGSGACRTMGMEPFDENESKRLAEAWAPVAHKYAGFLLPYAAEIVAVGTLLTIMWPRVKALDERRKAEKAEINRRAAMQKQAQGNVTQMRAGPRPPINPNPPETPPSLS